MDKDPNQIPPTRRKVKFAPVRKPKPRAAKIEARDKEDEESASNQALIRRFNENLTRREPKVEKKASVQVAFGPGSSSSLRTYGSGSGNSSGTTSKYSDKEQNSLTHSSTAIGDQSDTCMIDVAIGDQSDTCMIDVTDDTTNASARKTKKDYKEPWDYDHIYYPTTLPLRPPYSGDPEILDEEEFGDAATSVEYDENTVNSARGLGLLDNSEEQRMLFFQLPPLPLFKPPVSRKGKDIGTSAVSAQPKKESVLSELSGGYMGKMLVYKSGAVKLKLGETLFDVSPGSNCIFAQDVVAMNTAKKHCSVLGPISKKVVVTPDIDSLGL